MKTVLVVPVARWLQDKSFFHPFEGLGPVFPGHFHFRQVLAITRAEFQSLAQSGVSGCIAQRLFCQMSDAVQAYLQGPYYRIMYLLGKAAWEMLLN